MKTKQKTTLVTKFSFSLSLGKKGKKQLSLFLFVSETVHHAPVRQHLPALDFFPAGGLRRSLGSGSFSGSSGSRLLGLFRLCCRRRRRRSAAPTSALEPPGLEPGRHPRAGLCLALLEVGLGGRPVCFLFFVFVVVLLSLKYRERGGGRERVK